MKKFILITTINKPTEAIYKFSKLPDWHLIVVGDKKTPDGWNCSNVTYLSPKKQKQLNFKLFKYLPWNNYGRKMIGYLYAMNQGADIIAESDDDNIPLENWGNKIVFKGEYKIISGQKFFNAYKYFTNEFIWPRGFPLNEIKKPYIGKENKKIIKTGIWQFLADRDPDVDAIFRMIFNKKIFFKRKEPIVLNKNVVCPFNSQNTFFLKDFFSLLYLPTSVTFRFTDILRGIVAQPILWDKGYHLGFANATVVQKRNKHNLMEDFLSEVPVYLNVEKTLEIAKNSVKKNTGKNILSQMTLIYKELAKEGIVKKSEKITLEAWNKDLINNL